MNNQKDKNEEDVSYRGGGDLFGEPESKLGNSYNCPIHKQIPASEVEWHGIDPHCPYCGQKLIRSTIR